MIKNVLLRNAKFQASKLTFNLAEINSKALKINIRIQNILSRYCQSYILILPYIPNDNQNLCKWGFVLKKGSINIDHFLNVPWPLPIWTGLKCRLKFQFTIWYHSSLNVFRRSYKFVINKIFWGLMISGMHNQSIINENWRLRHVI